MKTIAPNMASLTVGYYGVSGDHPHRQARAGTDTPEAARFRQDGNALADAYTPACRAAGASTLETPGAVCGAEIDPQVRTCYCGHCAICRAGTDAQRAEEPQARENKDDANELSEDEQRQVEELQQRDREVRTHEQAHAAAGANNVRYDFQVGPNGRSYAVGGSADIEIRSGSDDPDRKMTEARRMRAAAMAPADPSAQDMAVAARASRVEAEARNEKIEAEIEETEETNHNQPAQAGFFAVA
jgi:hypothetical protein